MAMMRSAPSCFAARITDGLGAHSTIEAVGTQESMTQAIRSTRAGGHVGYRWRRSDGPGPGGRRAVTWR
jgi:hypothetical protein